MMPDQANGLQIVDWILIGIYAIGTIGLGAYFSRRQRTTEEYFVGNRNMNPLLVGVSLFATLLSTISYLSMPGECVGKGPVFLVSLLAFPFIYLVVAYVLLPVYMKQQVTSAYELLEAKLGRSTRILGAVMFLALRLVWMTLLIYLAAKAMTFMMGVEEKWIPLIVLITGTVAIVYTSLGGMQAVVITDFMQTILLLGGALLVVATVTFEFGGFGWFPTEWHANWDEQPIFSTNPKTRITSVGTVLMIFFWYVATMGGDQTSVQRFMTTKDLKAARRAFATQVWVSIIVQATLFLVGFALLGYFGANSDRLPDDMNLKSDADFLFPRFIAFHLPVGVSGLVVAAMFAAAMSSIDSGVNSITAVVFTDFLSESKWNPQTERGKFFVVRILSLSIGAVVVIGSSMIGFIEGNITAVTNKTVNLLTTPIFGLFFYALFVPFANPKGVWLGTFAGIVTAALIAFSGPFVYWLHTSFGIDLAVFNDVKEILKTDKATGKTWTSAEDPISFQWISPISFLVNITIGLSACWHFRNTNKQEAPDGHRA